MQKHISTASGLGVAGILIVGGGWRSAAGVARAARPAPALVAQKPMNIPNAVGRFDFIEVDHAMDRLLCSHTGNGTLDVFALGSGALIRSVRVGAAQSVAIDPASRQYYVTCSAE